MQMLAIRVRQSQAREGEREGIVNLRSPLFGVYLSRSSQVAIKIIKTTHLSGLFATA